MTNIFWRLQPSSLGSLCIAVTRYGVVFVTAVTATETKSKYFLNKQKEAGSVPAALQRAAKQWNVAPDALVYVDADSDVADGDGPSPPSESAAILQTACARIHQFASYMDSQHVSSNDVLLGLPIDWTFLAEHSSPLKLDVWRVLVTIPRGKVWDYSRVAKEAGHPTAVRAVASAIGQNFAPLVIPCHRVLRKDGSMGGFSFPGGIAVKKRLLQMEIRR
ncbi:6-O-methylguanine DNA methyltransferase [Obelidium mucronatum]|nr:6-O-methylguanine DNA methyltransferase [Obelidium mucronatum]